MKRLFSIMALVLISLVSIGQIRTVTLPNLNFDGIANRSVSWYYNGLAVDTLTANQDTLIFNILLNKSHPVNYYLTVALDTIDGADSVIVNVNGRMFDTQAWTLIETVAETAIPSATTITIESMTDADVISYLVSQVTATNMDTITVVPSIKPYYRQLQVEVIRTGLGEGLTFEKLQGYIAKLN